MSTTDVTDLVSDLDKYLEFEIEDIRYASPLLGIREVLEFQKPKKIPNTKDHFLGVINVRGSIVGVVDLNLKIKNKIVSDLNTKKNERSVVLIVETRSGMLGVIVDEVIAVRAISSNQIEKNSSVQTNIKSQYILGMTQNEENLILIINLNDLMADEVIVENLTQVG